MARFLINPTYEWDDASERYVLISHDGEYFAEPKILFDRGATGQAKAQGQTAGSVAGNAGANANQIYSSVVPGLERQAQTPQGYTPQQLNSMTTAAAGAVGGANAGITGEGRLNAIRTRSAGGLAPILDEAARSKSRTLANANLGIQNENANVGLQRQAGAQRALEGLYGTTSADQLKAMGLQNQDLTTQLQAGRQGWLQNTEGMLTSLGQLGQGVGAAAKAFS